MLVFIFFNVILAILVQSRTPYLDLLVNPIVLTLGIIVAAASLAAPYFRKIPSLQWHDAFCTAVMFIWFAYWKPEFKGDEPMFFFFPIYFALLSSLLTFSLIFRSRQFDAESVHYIRQLDKISRFDIKGAIVFLSLSLLVTRHYALFPVAMTFFLVRHTLVVCLEIIDNEK
jgi:hypothetical protein